MEDPTAHPDLAALGQTLQARFDRVVEAERRAAALAARRGASLRDRLLEAEDRGYGAEVITFDGGRHRGRLEAVGADHLELAGAHGRVVVALSAVAAVVLP